MLASGPENPDLRSQRQERDYSRVRAKTSAHARSVEKRTQGPSGQSARALDDAYGVSEDFLCKEGDQLLARTSESASRANCVGR